jgi:hypothetical protein
LGCRCLPTNSRRIARVRKWKQIAKRLDQRITTFDRIILGMQVAEWAGTAASLALGAGVVWRAVEQGGKWAVVKTVAKVAASGAAAYGVGEAVARGLRAAGASDETIHGVRLAAELVTWLLLLRRIGTAGIKPARPSAALSPAPKADPSSTISKGSIAGVRPLSVSGNPANRLVETGVPLKGKVGWQKRWTRMTLEDELRQAEAISNRYNEVIREAEHLSDDARKQYIFEQMRRFRMEYRATFLRNRNN